MELLSSFFILEDKIPKKSSTVTPNPIVITTIKLRPLKAFKFLIDISIAKLLKFLTLLNK